MDYEVKITLTAREADALRKWREGMGAYASFLASICDRVYDALPPEPLKVGDKVKLNYVTNSKVYDLLAISEIEGEHGKYVLLREVGKVTAQWDWLQNLERA